MKKIIALFLMVGFAFALSACGANNQYFKIEDKTLVLNAGQAIEINPYDLLNNEYTGFIPEAALDNLAGYYDVTVEYRDDKYSPHYNEFQFTNDKLIYEASPESGDAQLKVSKTYTLKIHFLDKEKQSEKDRINLIVKYEFLKSLDYKQESVLSGSTYQLLDNIQAYDSSAEVLDVAGIKSAYEMEYTVTKGDTDLSDSVDGGEITFPASGVYNVSIVFTDKTDDSITDTITYTVEATEGQVLTTTTADGGSGASE